jgi:hypothetical protein
MYFKEFLCFEKAFLSHSNRFCLSCGIRLAFIESNLKALSLGILARISERNKPEIFLNSAISLTEVTILRLTGNH